MMAIILNGLLCASRAHYSKSTLRVVLLPPVAVLHGVVPAFVDAALRFRRASVANGTWCSQNTGIDRFPATVGTLLWAAGRERVHYLRCLQRFHVLQL